MELQQVKPRKSYYVKTGKPKGLPAKVSLDKYEYVIEQYKQGRTLASIGDEFGVSRERIRQILSSLGITKLDGGGAIKSFLNCREIANQEKIKLAKKEKECFENYGCDLAFKRMMIDGYDYKSSPYMKYKNQRHSAEWRKIEWKLTLPEWWDIWQKSGHWEDRGFGGGKYVMARICDIGAYEIGNVEIITHNENSRESRLMDKVYNRDSCRKGTKYLLSGKHYTLKELSEIFNIKIATIRGRIERGYSVFDACTMEVKPWRC